MEVFVNNVRIEAPRGASLRDILSIASAPYTQGAIIAVGKGEQSIERKTNKFIIETTKGLIIFEVYSKKQVKLLNKTLKKTKEIMNIRFASANCIFVGSFDLNTQGHYRRYEIEEGDLFLSLIGLNIHDLCLVLSKERHEALYSIPEGEMLGRVVAGKEVLYRLNNKDYIKSIKPVITQEITRKNYCKTTNLDLKIDEERSRIHTFLGVTLLKNLPKSSELFLSLTRNKYFEIAFTTRSFVSSENLKGFKVSEENLLKRTRGCITIRKIGKGEGRVYIYREDRYPVSSHVVIGKVTDGMILVDLAQKGDLITVETNPQRINVVGLTQLEAKKRLSEFNIRQIRRGATSDKMVVVTQKPLLTMNILDSGSVETFGFDPKKILKVKLFYDKAPDSVKYFRLATGLFFNSIGSLKVFFPYSPIIGAILFKGDDSWIKNIPLPPENIPKDIVKKGEIGITNQVKKKAGLIGVRMIESKEFGPTCEAFEGTNIVGKIEEKDLEILKKMEKGEVYLREG